MKSFTKFTEGTHQYRIFLIGNWLLTASRDHLLKIFDIRKTKEELQTFRGHKKDVTTVAWHPVHEGIFASGDGGGSIMFWSVGAEKEVGAIEAAHEGIGMVSHKMATKIVKKCCF